MEDMENARRYVQKNVPPPQDHPNQLIIPMDLTATADTSEPSIPLDEQQSIKGVFTETIPLNELRSIKSAFIDSLKNPITVIDPQRGDHYGQMKMQPIEYIEANSFDFCTGNAIKYISRAAYATNADKRMIDLLKAKDYVDRLIAREMKNGSNRTE